MVKPASDTVLAAWELCQCFWRAGISRRTLQFFPAAGRGAANQLVQHPGLGAVILTALLLLGLEGRAGASPTPDPVSGQPAMPETAPAPAPCPALAGETRWTSPCGT